MRNAITVMNAKGGVGKSTLVLALAETLANDHDKKILVADSQTGNVVAYQQPGAGDQPSAAPAEEQ